MTTNIDDLVRQAQAGMADRAVSPSRIRDALPHRVTRARRQRRLGWAAVATAVATAIAVPALAVRPDRTTVPAGVVPVASATAPVPARHDLPLSYRLTWAPPGFAERIRSAGTAPPGDPLGPTVTRTWKKPTGAAELTLYVRTAVPDVGRAMDTTGQKVDVNGVRGWYQPSAGDHKSSLTWSPAPHTALILAAGHLDLSRSDMLRAARSVVAEPGTVRSPLRLDRLPAGWAQTGVTVSGTSPSAWRAEVDAAPVASPSAPTGKALKSAPATLSVIVAGTPEAPPGGTTLTVGGRPARHPVRTDAAGQTLTYLVVYLVPGRYLTLIGSGGLTLSDLSDVARQAQISDSGPDWL
jgi:hypothetical protein